MASKTTTIQIRVDADLKKQAVKVLGQMHITMSEAITMFLVQVVNHGKIPLEYLEYTGKNRHVKLKTDSSE